MKVLFYLIFIVLLILAGRWVYRWLMRSTTLPEPGPSLPGPGTAQSSQDVDLDDQARIREVTLSKRDAEDRNRSEGD